MKKTMQDSKRWELWERLAPVVLEREEGFGNITVGGATDQQGKDNLLDFIASEISKAREEGRREVIHKLKEEIDMAEVSKFIDAHQDFFNSFGESVLLKISKLSNK